MTDRQFQTLDLSLDEDVLRITFERPEQLNALDATMATELAAVVPAVVESSGAAAVVVTGSGGNFMAGADLDQLEYWMTLDRSDAVHSVGASFRADAFAELDVPVVAAVDGVAFGMGMDIALAADFVVLSDRAVFGLPETNVGVNPLGGSTLRLPRSVGVHRATRVIMLGERVNAATAVEWGLGLTMVAPDELEGEAMALAHKLARRSSTALAASKRLLRTSDDALDRAIAAELEAFADCLQGPDILEGIAAVRERRRPDFTPATNADR